LKVPSTEAVASIRTVNQNELTLVNRLVNIISYDNRP